ncbi:CPBP family intramembrane metalloprotease [Luteibacter aegosomatis]|uniref:CPBP family intramembrane glutamic endopeptidase n=1 Tax=Luteibacter aegosomatis TaxID=2911537 RepID=UPI001FF78278|nr:CPBP family intramembrane glutamic endopeptidase [Luteibacter aegosomatis]UPG84896.1 CPBP family intramembrane metalloprotease [Luteibacter aegosomatis]
MTPTASRPGLAARIARSAPGRLVIFFAGMALIGFVAGRVYAGLGLPAGPIAFDDVTPLIQAFRLAPVVLAYWLLVRSVESRRVHELAPRKAVPHLLLGLAGGLAAMSLVVGALWAMGVYVVTGVNHDAHWLGPILVLGVGAGVAEEIVSRGVIFRVVEEGLGTWAALLVSAAVFGGGHLWNPNATVWSAACIALEAGLLFGLLFHVTRSLWVCMGAHAAWNVAEGPLYGTPVSGFDQRGLLVSHLQGPEWLTGGAFGVEASVVTLALGSAITAACLSVAVSRHSLVPPFWRRRSSSTRTDRG